MNPVLGMTNPRMAVLAGGAVAALAMGAAVASFGLAPADAILAAPPAPAPFEPTPFEASPTLAPSVPAAHVRLAAYAPSRAMRDADSMRDGAVPDVGPADEQAAADGNPPDGEDTTPLASRATDAPPPDADAGPAVPAPE